MGSLRLRCDRPARALPGVPRDQAEGVEERVDFGAAALFVGFGELDEELVAAGADHVVAGDQEVRAGRGGDSEAQLAAGVRREGDGALAEDLAGPRAVR